MLYGVSSSLEEGIIFTYVNMVYMLGWSEVLGYQIRRACTVCILIFY